VQVVDVVHDDPRRDLPITWTVAPQPSVAKIADTDSEITGSLWSSEVL
jgi:hypothetical protein